MSLGIDGTWANTGHPESCPDINPVGCSTHDVPPEWHDITLYYAELRLRAEYSFTDWLAAELQWSLRTVVQRFVLEDLATRQPITAPFGVELHHRNETLVGLTDPWVGLHAAKVLGHWVFLFRGGVTLPVGATVPNPFELTREGKEHEHIQFGTGTVNPYAAVELKHVMPHLTVSTSLLAKVALYENSHGYKAGNSLLGAIHAFSDLFTQKWIFGVGALLYKEFPETWAGIEEEEGNLGRMDVLVDASVLYRLPRAFTIGLSARVPVHTIAAGEQLATPAILDLTVSRPFQF